MAMYTRRMSAPMMAALGNPTTQVSDIARHTITLAHSHNIQTNGMTSEQAIEWIREHGDYDDATIYEVLKDILPEVTESKEKVPQVSELQTEITSLKETIEQKDKTIEQKDKEIEELQTELAKYTAASERAAVIRRVKTRESKVS